MIDISYIKDDYDAGAYSSCACCLKRFEQDPGMVRIKFDNVYRHAVAVNLCDDCRRELSRKLANGQPGRQMVDIDHLKKHIAEKNAETRAFGSVGELLVNAWIDEVIDADKKRRTE